MEEKKLIIQKILNLQEINKNHEEKINILQNRLKEIEDISIRVKETIEDQAEREIELLNNERTFISQNALKQEELMKNNYEQKLLQILKQKEETERKLEAESENLSRTMKKRLNDLLLEGQKLRTELAKKSHQMSEQITNISPNEAINLQIFVSQEHCTELANKIAFSHREIEGLNNSIQKLKLILNKFNDENNYQQNICKTPTTNKNYHKF